MLEPNQKRSMARNDDSKRNPNAPSRVYKASDVHKRRVDRKGREKKSAPIPEEDVSSKRRRQNDDRPADARREGGRQDDAKSQAASPDNRSQAEPVDIQSKEAVVIAPQFGRRTEAQRQADDRWFAAMRERDEAAFNAVHPASEGALDSGPAEFESQADAGANGQVTQEIGVETTAAPDSSADGRSASSPAPKGQTEQKPMPDGGPASDEAPDALRKSGVQPSGEGPLPPMDQASIEEGADDEDLSEARPQARRKLSRKARVAIIIGAIVLVAGIVVAALFVWNRWYRFDDHADMQGEWYVVGTTVPVTIDETSIHLTGDVTYNYEINAHDKTISYSFGTMKGQGRYWFSDDRKYLVITDGDEFTGSSTAIDDLLHAFKDLTGKVSGSEAKLPEGEGIIAFSRAPDADALARQKKEAADKAAAEAAARQEAERRAAEEAAAAEGENYSYEEEYVEEPVAEPAGEPPANEPAPAEEPPAEEPVRQEAPPEG